MYILDLVYLFRFWSVGPRKIWQPCSRRHCLFAHFQRETKLEEKLKPSEKKSQTDDFFFLQRSAGGKYTFSRTVGTEAMQRESGNLSDPGEQQRS
jgi:hypothetical protein